MLTIPLTAGSWWGVGRRRLAFGGSSGWSDQWGAVQLWFSKVQSRSCLCVVVAGGAEVGLAGGAVVCEGWRSVVGLAAGHDSSRYRIVSYLLQAARSWIDT